MYNDTFSKCITFLYSFNTKDPAIGTTFQRNLWFKLAQSDLATVFCYFIQLTLS